MKAPWFMCNGWRSPWCVLDILLRCKVPYVCKRHDAEQVKAFNRVVASLPPVDVTVAKPSTWSNGTGTSNSMITVYPSQSTGWSNR
jgi:hypothetical protein